jgi:hypothetical protein
MPRVIFEPTTPVFDRAKTVHALDSVATVKPVIYESIIMIDYDYCQYYLQIV